MRNKLSLSPDEAWEALPELLSEEFLEVLDILTRVETPKPLADPAEVMWGHAQRALYEKLVEIHQNHVLLHSQAAED